jgi:hypothetical protein
LVEFRDSELVRRTLVFYTITDRAMVVEERMLARAPSEEDALRQYVEEVLLGPVSPDSMPLFSRETRLRSLLYRDRVVYLDLSEPAALPPVEGASRPEVDVFETLQEGIRRNFPPVREVKFFISGHEVFYEIFAGKV